MPITVRFSVENPDVRPGDVLLVLSGSDIHFHGMIGMIEDGRGVATDRVVASLRDRFAVVGGDEQG